MNREEIIKHLLNPKKGPLYSGGEMLIVSDNEICYHVTGNPGLIRVADSGMLEHVCELDYYPMR